MLVHITQQDVVYGRYLVSGRRSHVPDFGVYITIQGANGDVEYRTISRQLVLFCVERRKAWRLLQSKRVSRTGSTRRSGRCWPTWTQARSHGRTSSRTPRGS
jgi:hypothetical protein